MNGVGIFRAGARSCGSPTRHPRTINNRLHLPHSNNIPLSGWCCLYICTGVPPHPKTSQVSPSLHMSSSVSTPIPSVSPQSDTQKSLELTKLSTLKSWWSEVDQRVAMPPLPWFARASMLSSSRRQSSQGRVASLFEFTRSHTLLQVPYRGKPRTICKALPEIYRCSG
jgi:hypothetical protein